MGMTEQEAIEELKNYRACSGTQLPEEMEVAIEALEKQIPKKPIIEPWCPAKCPTCGCELSESLGDGYYKHYTHLGRCLNNDCAQKLDWGNEDD